MAQQAAQQIGARALGSAIGALAAKLLEPIVEPMLEAVGSNVRTWLFDRLGWLRPVTREPLTAIETARPDRAFGMNLEGVEDALQGMIWSSIKVMYIHPELADEFVLELIQEGTSNAIQYNLGGAVQSILNVWRGAYPLEPNDIGTTLGPSWDQFDDAAAFLLAAQAGANIPATAAYMVTGMNQGIGSELAGVEARLVEAASRLESLALHFHTVAVELATHVIVEAIQEPVYKVERIANMLRYMYERALARLQEYLAELYTIKLYVDSGVLKPESGDHLATIVKAEAEMLYNAVLETERTLYTAMEQAVTVDLSWAVELALRLLAEVARVYVHAVEPAGDLANRLVDEAHARLSNVLALLTMFRTYWREAYEAIPPVEVVAEESQAEVKEPQPQPEAGGESSEQG